MAIVIPDVKKPTVPLDPVEATRQAQQPLENPKAPLVKPEDSASRIKQLLKPKKPKILGTDKPKKKKYKVANTANTSTPSYLKPLTPPRGVAVAKEEVSNLEKLKELVNYHVNNPDEYQLEKLSVPSMAAFGLGYYLSDSMTRDHKDKYIRHLEDEWDRTLKRQEKLNRLKEPIQKSCFDQLTDWYLENTD